MPPERKLHRWWWWSAEERQKFRRRLRRASPYILLLLLPGSFILLPLYALWRQWLRRKTRAATPPLPERLVEAEPNSPAAIHQE